jgi:hypothetical protein
LYGPRSTGKFTDTYGSPEDESDIKVIGGTSDRRAIVKFSRTHQPTDATRQIENLSCETPVIALSMHADQLFVQEVLKVDPAALS